VARDRHETIIGGHRYQMTMLGATASSHMFVRLIKMIAPALSGLKSLPTKDNTKSILDTDLEDFAMLDFVAILGGRLTEQDFDYVVAMLREECHVGIDGSEKTVPLKDIYELHFAGDLPGILQWLAWGLKVQFGNFQGAFASLIPPDVAGAFRAAAVKSQ
jgi:hypothetical protein